MSGQQPGSPRSPSDRIRELSGYSLAVLFAIAAVVLRRTLDPLFGQNDPLTMLYPAILIVAFYLGFGPGLVTATIGCIAAIWFILPPRQTLVVAGLENWLQLAMYSIVSIGIAFTGGRMREALDREKQLAAECDRETERLRTTLNSIGDAVITTGAQGRIDGMNQVAVDLTGWTLAQAMDRPAAEVFKIIDDSTRESVPSPVTKAIAEKRIVKLANPTLLVDKNGASRPIDDSASPILNAAGTLEGAILVFRDVSRRREAEERLRRSEQDLHDFFENANVGLQLVGPDGVILRANRAELEMLGYLSEEYVGHPIAEFHADRESIDGILQRLAAGETLKEFPSRIRRKDGSIRDVRINSSPLWLEGRIVHSRCFTTDVTDRLHAEKDRSLLAAVVQNSEDAIVTKSLDGRITTWNAGAERLFEYTAAEAIGQSIMIIIPPGRRAEEETILDRLRRGERIEHFETLRVAKGGREIEISLSISPIFDAAGRMIGASKVGRDIGERKRAEETLRLSGTRLRLLWESAKVLLTSDDPHAMLSDMFARIAPHFGLDVYFNYMFDESTDTLELTSYAGIADEEALSIRRLDTSQGVCGAAAQERRPIVACRIQESDDPKTQFMKSSGIRSSACNPLIVEERLLGTLNFASRSRDTFSEEDLAFLATICHYVTLAYERLRLMRELHESDRRKDAFLATLAHELRNPLAPVRSSLEIVKRAKDDPELRETAWNVIDRQMLHLERLVDDLLELSRIHQDKLELRRSRIELATAIQHAIELSAPLAELLGHELTVTLPHEPLCLDADPARLVQIFGNLLNNACKYTDPEGRIEVAAERLGGDVIVSVRDNGAGIAPEMLSRVFDMFAQIDQSREHARGGLGIGLTLVRRLVEMHGGHVEAFSEGLGKGSEFIVQLPLAGKAPAANAPRPDPVSPGAARRILVVDDNRDGAKMLANLLELVGHRTQLAYDGLEAIAAAEVFLPEVILLDLGLPRLNGYEAARKIRKQPWSKGMILIALTGWGQEDDRRRTKQAGFDHHLVKPVDIDSLSSLLAEAPGPMIKEQSR